MRCSRVGDKERKTLKRYFKEFFEGVYDWQYDDHYELYNTNLIQKPKTNVPLMHLSITNLKVYRYKGVLTLAIFSERPGMVIGKGAKQFDAIREYLKERAGEEILLKLYESKIFS